MLERTGATCGDVGRRCATGSGRRGRRASAGWFAAAWRCCCWGWRCDLACPDWRWAELRAFGSYRPAKRPKKVNNDMEKTSGGAVRFAGYASVFDHADRSGDIVRKGAFARAVAAGPKGVPLLWQHDPKRPIRSEEHKSEPQSP